MKKIRFSNGPLKVTKPTTWRMYTPHVECRTRKNIWICLVMYFCIILNYSRLNLNGISTCTWNVKKPPKKIVSNYLNGAFLMLTSLQILPVTVLSLGSVFCPIIIKQGCFDQTSRARFQKFSLFQPNWAVNNGFFFPANNDQPMKSLLSGRCDWCFPVGRIRDSYANPRRSRGFA